MFTRPKKPPCVPLKSLPAIETADVNSLSIFDDNTLIRGTVVDFTPIVGLEPTTLGLTVPRSTS